MKKTPLLSASHVVAGYDHKIILNTIDLVIPSNKISVIIGANACGKSTLLKTLARLIKPVSGEVALDGKPISTIPPKQLARVLGLLPQSPVVPEGIAVADLVSRGRFPYQGFLKGLGKKDYEAVEEANIRSDWKIFIRYGEMPDQMDITINSSNINIEYIEAMIGQACEKYERNLKTVQL